MAVAPIGVAANIDVDVGTVRTVLSRASHCSSSQTTVSSIAAMIATVHSIMPSCCLVATTIVLGPIKLGTTTTLGIKVSARIAVTIDSAILVIWVCDVEIVVHTIMGLTQIHVPSHTTAREIE